MSKIIKFIDKSEILDVSSEGIVDIQITRYNEYDSDKDRLLAGALNRTWKNGGQVHLVNHNMWEMSSFVGLPIKTFADTGVVRSKLNLKKTAALDLFNDYVFSIENGRSMQHSHGFRNIKSEKNPKGGRDFSEVQQYEYSTVLFGAVSDTPLHSIKSDFQLQNYIADFESYINRFNGTEETAKKAESILIQLKSFQNSLKGTFDYDTIKQIDDPSQDTRTAELLKQLYDNLKN